MISSYQMAKQCEAWLVAHGCDAFVRCDESTDGEVELYAPQLEDRNGLLCQQRINLLVSKLLDASGRKGLLLHSPVSGRRVGVYCFHPLTFAACDDGSDVEFWPASAGADFCWSQLETDSSDWCGGWPVDRSYEVGERIAFITALMSADVVDLPRRLPIKESGRAHFTTSGLTTFVAGQ